MSIKPGTVHYYDPTTAQFLTRDPLEATTNNPYGYTDGNPLQYTDPLGLDWLQNLSDFSAGFGDTITFGGTREIRRLINYGLNGETDDMVDNCATAYAWGGYTAMAADLVLGGAGIVTSVRSVMQAGRLAETASAAGRAVGSGAESAIARRNLGRQLASEQQMAEAGTHLAGAGSGTKLRAAERLAADYGGSADDWAKMGSSSYRGADGLQLETHWYENVLTGGRFEFKTKTQWLP